jgi:hypothetical protein
MAHHTRSHLKARSEAMTSIFGYVARSSSRAETDATKALEFILEVSEAHEIAKAGFRNLLRQIQPQLPDLTRFHTDATQTGAGIPDVVGSDRGSQPWALIENKFHAALTVHQPVGYLTKLPPGGLLLFIVPDFRQRPIQRTIDEKLRQDGIEPPRWEHPPEPDGISRGEIDGRTIAVTTWAVALTAMLSNLAAQRRTDATEQTRAHIGELQSLCDEMDKRVDFVPLSVDKLTSTETPRLVEMLEKLADKIASELVHRDLIQYSAASTDQWEREAGYHGKYLFVGLKRDKRCWFGVSYQVWQRHGLTPLWWMIHKRDLDPETN